MVYRQQFALAIKCNKKILREHDGKVYIPFEMEYKIVLKNLSSVRAKVKVMIDGEDISNKFLIVVNPNQSLDLERFIRDKEKGNKFKFIERTSSIEDYRGIRVDDGIVRIEYQFEAIKPSFPSISQPIWGGPLYHNYPPIYAHSSGILRSESSINCNSAYQSFANNIGITAPGSISEQRFDNGQWFEVDPRTYSLCLHLVGKTLKLVEAPLLVSSKPECSSCGKLNKSSSKFCTECGTSLTIF